MRTVSYFPNQCARNSVPVMNAILEYLQANGYTVEANSLESDIAIIWSVLWNGRMANNQQVYEHYRQQGKPVIIVEVGALYRDVT